MKNDEAAGGSVNFVVLLERIEMVHDSLLSKIRAADDGIRLLHCQRKTGEEALNLLRSSMSSCDHGFSKLSLQQLRGLVEDKYLTLEEAQTIMDAAMETSDE